MVSIAFVDLPVKPVHASGVGLELCADRRQDLQECAVLLGGNADKVEEIVVHKRLRQEGRHALPNRGNTSLLSCGAGGLYDPMPYAYLYASRSLAGAINETPPLYSSLAASQT